MNTQTRRQNILNKLISAEKPISASTLASELQVTRQVIVGDVALLRASGYDIIATPRGYVLENHQESHPYVGIVACKHDQEQLPLELYTIVDYGGTAIDVTIEHSIYGQLSGSLNISSRYEADLFVENVSGDCNKPLCSLSGGIHLHKIGCKNEEIFNIIKEKLKEAGVLL
jgi:transcriptional regulator of NAD metabolism